MKNLIKKHKTIVKVLESILLLSLVVLLLSFSYKVSQKNVCKHIHINLTNSDNIKFVNEQEIKNLIERNVNHFIIGNKSESIDIQAIEAEVKKISFVKAVEAFVNSNGDLDVNVIQRKPIIRVINKNSVSYYIDENKKKFPTSNNFTARVAVVSGNIEDNGFYEGNLKTKDTNEIFEFAKFVEQDEFWRAMVEQIYINNKKELSFIPKWGNTEVKLGKLKGYKNKLKKLKIYYKQNINKDNWIKCKAINLKFKNQVLCETEEQ